MKYLIFVSSLIVLLLTWCSQNNIQINKLATSWELYKPILEQTWKDLFLWATLIDWGYFDWIYSFIIISWNLLTYSWIFTINIPEALYTREYIGHNDTEYIWFKDKNMEKNFSIHTRKITWIDSILSDKELCKVEYYDWFLSKSEKIQDIQGRKIYIYYATLMVSTPDTTPFKVIDTQFCFVDSGMIYNFSTSNYTHIYMDSILHSFSFLD